MAPSSTSRPAPGLALGAALLLGAGAAGAAPADPSGDLAHIRPLIDQTLETEKSGIEIRWSNPGTGHSGMMRVERTFFRDQRPCRDYLRTVLRPGESGFVIRGTACRAGRAEWDILDEVVTEMDAPKKRAAAVRPAPAPDAPAPERQAAPRPSAATPGAAAAAGAPSAPEAEGPPVEEAPLLRKAKRLAAEAGEAPAPGPRFVPFTLPSRSAL